MAATFTLMLKLVVVVDVTVISIPVTEQNITNDVNFFYWSSFVSHFCGRTCQNGSLIITPNLCTYPTCFPCDCDGHCALKGTCCPTMESNVERRPDETDQPDEEDYLDGMNTRLECAPLPTLEFELFLTVVRCPKTWTDKNIQHKCEQPSGESLDSVTPFSDLNSGLVYTNVFCVVCNGLDPFSITDSADDKDQNRPDDSVGVGGSDKIQPWSLEIHCLHYQNLYHIVDRFDLYETARGLEECHVSFVETKQITKCPLEFEPPKDPHCSPAANQTIQGLCYDLPEIRALRVSRARNLFCFMCEEGGDGIEREEDCTETVDPFTDPGFLPPIVFLFITSSRRENNNEEIVNCLPYQWKDEKGHCDSATCPNGKTSTNESTCESVMSDIRGLKYNIQMTLVPQKFIPEFMYSHVNSAIDRILINGSKNLAHTFLTKKYNLEAGQGHGTDQSKGEITSREQMIRVQGIIKAPGQVTRDEFESEILNTLKNGTLNVTVIDDKRNTQIIDLRIVCLGEEMCDIYHQRYNKTTWNGSQYNSSTALNSTFLDITPSLVCPSVAFNLTTNPIVIDNDIVFTFELRNHVINITWDMNISTVDGQFSLCLSLLKDLIRTFNSPPSSTDRVMALIVSINYYSDIACIAVSCVCLLASILTYLIFSSLRCLAGLNNLCLCVSLFTAHTCLLISSVLGNRGLLPRIHCLVHAIILHYSWLASFFWMNTCCIHMFHVFTSKNVRSKGKFTYYCLYSFGLPVLIVVSTITMTTVFTNGNSIGYSSDICFLDRDTSNLIIYIALLTPAGGCCLANKVLFTLTLKEMIWVKSLQQQSRSNNGIKTYVKLSTVTGAFFAFAATAAQFDSPILSLISSPFVALQGVFIFMSFIANKRTLEMYSTRFFPQESSGSSTQSVSSVWYRNKGKTYSMDNSEISEIVLKICKNN